MTFYFSYESSRTTSKDKAKGEKYKIYQSISASFPAGFSAERSAPTNPTSSPSLRERTVLKIRNQNIQEVGAANKTKKEQDLAYYPDLRSMHPVIPRGGGANPSEP